MYGFSRQLLSICLAARLTDNRILHVFRMSVQRRHISTLVRVALGDLLRVKLPINAKRRDLLARQLSTLQTQTTHVYL